MKIHFYHGTLILCIVNNLKSFECEKTEKGQNHFPKTIFKHQHIKFPKQLNFMSGFINSELTILQLSQQFALLIAIKIRKYQEKLRFFLPTILSLNTCVYTMSWSHVHTRETHTPVPSVQISLHHVLGHMYIGETYSPVPSVWISPPDQLDSSHCTLPACAALAQSVGVQFTYCTKQEASSYHSSLVLHRHFSSV